MNPEINPYEDYRREYDASISDPQGFWDEKASKLLWEKKWEKTLEWNFNDPANRWFIGGKINITENCLDRHLKERGNQTAFALQWEPWLSPI